MFKRPSVKDSEEDILRQQAEFFKNIKKEEPVNDVPKSPNVGETPKVDHRLTIIGKIIERKTDGFIESTKVSTNQSKGSFPEVFHIDPVLAKTSKGKKKSLFALKLEEKSKKEELPKEAPIEIPKTPSYFPELLDVHKENEEKIRNMRTEDILSERQSLEGMLSPDMIAFLKKRGSSKKVNIAGPSEDSKQINERVVDVKAIKENIIKTVDRDWMDMDRIEPEKLEWIGDIPDSQTLEPDQPYSARFDFLGDLQPLKSEIDVRSSLHHHGDEPERPGYTIQELYQLCRSSVLQQRILALNTLANVIRKTKMGYYDKCFDGVLLRKLVESDVFFLLRFAMDDRTVTPAAVNCLNEFFCCRSDEVCLDRLLNITEEDEEPILIVPFEMDNETTEQELKDHLILEQDIIKGVLRTDILVRLNYILREFSPDNVVKGKIFETISRVCRHSPESCEKVFNTTGLILAVFENINSSEPLPQAVKVLRVLFSNFPDSVKSLKGSHSFSFILKLIDMDAPAFKLKLECLSLWKALIRNGIMLNEFSSFTPSLTRLLFFYVEKVDTCHGRFDFELFSGIVSLINIVSKTERPDRHYNIMIQRCLQKWFTQLHRSACNYSIAKAIGTCLRFLTLTYTVHGVETSDLDFLKLFCPLLVSYFKSEEFLKQSQNLNTTSHIQSFQVIDRDPSNLPSLNAVYLNGSGYVAFLQDSSCLPLYVSLANFLLRIMDISNKSEPLLQAFTNSVGSYFLKTLNFPENSSWFSRYEVKLLAATAEIYAKLNHIHSLKYCFSCLPFFRTDDQHLLNIVRTIFKAGIWPENLVDIYKNYFSSEFKKIYFHDTGNVRKDWIYGPIIEHCSKVLKFLSTILETSPESLSGVPYTIRYYRICNVLLDENNIFDNEIHNCLKICFKDIINNFQTLDFNIRVSTNKSFYEFYMELVTQYAGISYGNPLFAKFITLPLAQKFDVSFRKLLWSEYMHVIRVITLPDGITDFVPLDLFVTPVETDESLLVIYLNAVSKNVVTPTRNGFIYAVATENIKRYLACSGKDERLSKFIVNRINSLSDQTLKNKLLNI